MVRLNSYDGGDDCDDDPTTGFLTHPDIAIFEADPTICYRDNDEDGFTDAQDPGCEDGYDDEEEDPSTECNDEIDNDSDGWTDLDDPVCVSIAVELEDDSYGGAAQCNDGIDNDTDGDVDADDANCFGADDNAEAF